MFEDVRALILSSMIIRTDNYSSSSFADVAVITPLILAFMLVNDVASMFLICAVFKAEIPR